MPLLWDHGLGTGDPIGGSLFPQVLPAPIAGECERRTSGPEPPDLAYAQKVLASVQVRRPKS